MTVHTVQIQPLELRLVAPTFIARHNRVEIDLLALTLTFPSFQVRALRLGDISELELLLAFPAFSVREVTRKKILGDSLFITPQPFATRLDQEPQLAGVFPSTNLPLPGVYPDDD